MKAKADISISEKDRKRIGRTVRRDSHNEMMKASSVKGGVRENKKAYKRNSKHLPDWKKL